MSETRERSFWGWGWADQFQDRETRKGFGQQVQGMLGFAPQEEGEIDAEIARMMADLDGGGKGSINFDEFLEAVTTKAAASGASVFDGTGAARDEAAGGATARDLAQRLEEAKVQRLVAAVKGAPGPAALDSHSLVE